MRGSRRAHKSRGQKGCLSRLIVDGSVYVQHVRCCSRECSRMHKATAAVSLGAREPFARGNLRLIMRLRANVQARSRPPGRNIKYPTGAESLPVAELPSLHFSRGIVGHVLGAFPIAGEFECAPRDSVIKSNCYRYSTCVSRYASSPRGRRHRNENARDIRDVVSFPSCKFFPVFTVFSQQARNVS